ncbi:MAG: RNA-binding protein [Polyangiales bacterium]
MSGNFGTGKRQREAEQTKKRQEKEQRRLAKRDRRPAEIEIVSADEIQGNLPSIEEAMAALENPGQVQRSAASIPARLFVGGVADDVSEQALRAVFEQYGNVAEVVIMKDRVTRAPRGFGFVTMADRRDATRAIENLDGSEFHGRRLAVNVATDRR